MSLSRPAIGALVVLWALPASAGDRSVRITGQASDALRTRIAGQVADLPWSIEPEGGDAQVDVRRDPGGVWVIGLSDRHGRGFERQVQASPGESESATFETLALVIRSGLRELQAPPPVRPTPVEPPPAPRPRWFASAGGGVVAASGEDGLRAAVGVGGGLRTGRWRLGVQADLGLPSSLQDEWTDVSLSRHSLRAVVAAEVVRDGDVAFDVGGSSGLLVIDRSTESDRPEVGPTRSRLSSALAAGPELGLSWGRVRLGVGVDLVVGEPTLKYRVDGRLHTRHQPWPLQPRIALSAGVGEGID